MYYLENVLCGKKVPDSWSGYDTTLHVSSAGLHNSLAQAHPQALVRPERGKGPYPSGPAGPDISQQTRTAKLFRHCRSLQIGTPHWVIPANRSLRNHSKLTMCRILESSKTRITSLHSTAIPTGHHCVKGIEMKCSFSFFLRLLGRGLY